MREFGIENQQKKSKMFTTFSNPTDRFDTNGLVGQVKLTNERRTVYLPEPADNYVTLFGEAEIEVGKFEWSVRVDKAGDRQAVIGVATGSALAQISGKFCDETTGFGYGVNGLFRSGGEITAGKGRDCSLSEGDVLFIRLDLKLKTLQFAKNGILLDIIIPRVAPGKYRLAIALVDEGEQYTIVNPTDYLARFAMFQFRISQ
ncbi:hypothetical protein RFI_05643, partial [Reticulomyxa filosa]